MFNFSPDEIPMLYMIGGMFIGLLFLYIQIGIIPEQRNKKYHQELEDNKPA